MSEGMPITDFFKSSPEVTSLASTDRILAIGSNGEPKKISRAKVKDNVINFEPSAPQWIRIGKFVSGAVVTLSIFSKWETTPGFRVLVDLILHANSPSYNFATVLSKMSHAKSSVFTKLRVVTKTSTVSYVDIYYNGNGNNGGSVASFNDMNFDLLTPEMDAQIPDGYNVKEFDLTQTAWGGGKRLFFNRLQFHTERRWAV